MNVVAIQFQPKGYQLSKSNKRRHHPSDPAEIARRRMEAMSAEARKMELEARAKRDPAMWNIDPVLMGLEANENIVTGRDVAGKITRAKRWDVFALLRASGTLTGDHIIVLDKLQRLMAVRARTAGASGFATAVDGMVATDYPKAQVEAGVRVDGLVAFMDAEERAMRYARGMAIPPHRAKLLDALSKPMVERGRPVPNWRNVVEQITGEFRDTYQAKEVAAACDALERAFEARADDEALKDYYRKREAA